MVSFTDKGSARVLSSADLRRLLDLAGQDLSEELRGRVVSVAQRVEERDALDPLTIVVAFVGATGSGKSSLFNAVCGADLARSDVVRPTTRVGLAAVPNMLVEHGASGGADALLDWMGVQQRVELPQASEVGSSIVVIDVPDIDSIDRDNGQLAARLAERVDVLIWVVDPQKYADDIIHSQWIAPMSSRAQGMLVVLNQVDRLSDDERQTVGDSLQRLLVGDGLVSPRIIQTSALSGEGVPQLVSQINEIADVVRSTAVTREAQLRDISDDIRRELDVESWNPRQSVDDVGALVARTIGASAPIEAVVSAVGGAYTHRRVSRCGWLPWQFLRKFRSDPLRRWHLSGGGQESRSDVDLSGVMGASGVSVALRHAMGELEKGRPSLWADRLREESRRQGESLTAALQRGIARTDLSVGTVPAWWRFSNGVQWLMWLVFLAGVAWLGVAHLFESYLLIPLHLPRYGELPIPTWLVLGGLLATLIVASVSSLCGWFGARRRVRRARQRLQAMVEVVVGEHIAQPLAREDQRQRAVVELVM